MRIFLSLLAIVIVLHTKLEGSQTPLDICDFSLIYNDQFQYCVPEDRVRSFFDGTACDRKEPYSPDEIQRLKDDINAIYADIMKENPLREKLAVMTAGSPGSGKTILMRQYLEREGTTGQKIAYVDPDDVCLINMKNTWVEALKNTSEKEDEREIKQKAYDDWRPGSNAAAHLILANLIRQNFAFYFGTTASGRYAPNTFRYLKERGYRIHLIHISAPDDIRWDSIRERDKTFVQTTEEDIREKKKLVPQRINDTFLKYADQIDFYYRNKVDGDFILTAVWTNTGKLTIHNRQLYESMVQLHNAICDELNDPSIRWENSVEKQSN